eukprot:jgi/Psemu1/291522/fgenesh1_pg.726_\
MTSLPPVNDDETMEILPLSLDSPLAEPANTGVPDNSSGSSTSDAASPDGNSNNTEKIVEDEEVSGTRTTTIETEHNNSTKTTENQPEQQECTQEGNQKDSTLSSPKEELIEEENNNNNNNNESIDCSKEDNGNIEVQLNKEETSETQLKGDGDGDGDVALKETGTNISDSAQQKTDSGDNDDDIEWLSPETEAGDSTNTVDHVDTNQLDPASANGTNAPMEPLKMLKKGAVAVAGGTMVGVGLVMIPLPTPFGAVVASSGLAVLGTEFGEAKELNDRLIDGAKGHLNNARDAIVEGIENMNSEHDDDDEDDDIYGGDLEGGIEIENNEGAGGAIIIVKSTSHGKATNANIEVGVGRGDNSSISTTTTTTTNNNKMGEESSDNKDTDNSEVKQNNISSENESIDITESPPPLWLHMNPIERERQVKMARLRYRRENQTTLEQAKEAFTKRTGKFLSKNLLPLIKKKEQPQPAVEVVEFVGVSPLSAATRDDNDTHRGISDAVPVASQDLKEPTLLVPELTHSGASRTDPVTVVPSSNHTGDNKPGSIGSIGSIGNGFAPTGWKNKFGSFAAKIKESPFGAGFPYPQQQNKEEQPSMPSTITIATDER